MCVSGGGVRAYIHCIQGSLPHHKQSNERTNKRLTDSKAGVAARMYAYLHTDRITSNLPTKKYTRLLYISRIQTACTPPAAGGEEEEQEARRYINTKQCHTSGIYPPTEETEGDNVHIMMYGMCSVFWESGVVAGKR